MTKPISRSTVAFVVLLLTLLGVASCRGCDERYQAYLDKMALREGACYAMPLRDATQAVRELLADEKFPLPPADDTGLIVTGWKDTTVQSTRLTFRGRPARARREILLAGGPCLRFAVREITQSTPKKGPDYGETRYGGSLEEDDLAARIHERLQAHQRPWQPPPF